MKYNQFKQLSKDKREEYIFRFGKNDANLNDFGLNLTNISTIWVIMGFFAVLLSLKSLGIETYSLITMAVRFTFAWGSIIVFCFFTNLLYFLYMEYKKNKWIKENTK